MKEGSTLMDRYLLGYRLHCIAEAKSPRTVTWYEQKLRIFRDYLTRQFQVTDPAAVTADHIRRFLAHMRDDVRVCDVNPCQPSATQPLSPHTVQGYYRSIHAFFSWLKREECIEKDPVANIRRPKVPETLVPTFSAGQIRNLLATSRKKRRTDFRDYAILLLLLDTGVRLAELTRLQEANLHLEEGYIQVLGKGNKERKVPLGVKVRKVLWQYLARYRPEPVHPRIANVFLNQNGTPMTPGGVYRMIARRGKEAGVTGVRCSPHTFRHTFAVSYLRNGGDVFSLQKILGHTSLIVTRMYCQLNDEDVQASHRACGPVDRLEWG